MHEDDFIKITISLAKVFNSGIITEEEAEKIISINEVISDSANPIKNNIATFWKIVDYFDKEFQEKIEQIKKEFKEATKIEEIINLAEKKYKKEFEEINTLHFDIYGEHTNPIPRMFGIMPIGLSFFESQFATDESYMEWMIFLSKSNYIAGENIIDLTLALSEIFNRNMTKEEAEKLLFVKSEMPKENIENYGLPPCQYLASEEFRNIIYKNKNEYIYGIYNGVSYVTSSLENGIEKEYKRKKLFFGTITFVMLLSLACVIYTNLTTIDEKIDNIKNRYLIYVSSTVVDEIDKRVSSGNYKVMCDDEKYSGEDGTYYFEYADASDEFNIFLGSFVDPVSVVVRMDVNQGNRTYYVSLTNGELGFENIESNSIDINSITNYSEINKNYSYTSTCFFK